MLVKRWYGALGLPRHSATWYTDRLAEEIEELGEAKTAVEKLSESSDVYFARTRAFYDGYPILGNYPPSFGTAKDILVYAYMIGKTTSRWAFYRTAATLARAPRADLVREVVNPSKDSKLEVVAARHGIEPATFKKHIIMSSIPPSAVAGSGSGSASVSHHSEPSGESSAPSITSLIDDSEQYRIGYPGPLEPLPLQTDIVTDPSQCQQFELVKGQILEVLATRKSCWQIMNLTLRYPRHHQRPSRCTILVDTTKSDADEASWTRAFYDCVILIQVNKVDMGIEFQDPRSVKTFFIPHCDPRIHQLWDNPASPETSMRRRVLNMLQQHGEWSAMTVLRYGAEETHSPLAIVISTKEGSRRDWNQVK
ncbi:MAG: hypothetical protein Q9191_006464 [Dirinaria sp. TL-2023a]